MHAKSFKQATRSRQTAKQTCTYQPFVSMTTLKPAESLPPLTRVTHPSPQFQTTPSITLQPSTTGKAPRPPSTLSMQTIRTAISPDTLPKKNSSSQEAPPSGSPWLINLGLVRAASGLGVRQTTPPRPAPSPPPPFPAPTPGEEAEPARLPPPPPPPPPDVEEKELPAYVSPVIARFHVAARGDRGGEGRDA